MSWDGDLATAIEGAFGIVDGNDFQLVPGEIHGQQRLDTGADVRLLVKGGDYYRDLLHSLLNIRCQTFPCLI